jgi:cyanophycinase
MLSKLLLTVFCFILSAHLLAAKFYYKDNFLKYHTSHSLDERNQRIERLVIVVHGALRNGDVYFENTLKAAITNHVQHKTIVLAPHFKREADPREHDEIYYGRRWYQKWKYGHLSQDSDRVSSFTLIDEMILSISQSGNFPNLKNIVVTGHSAGGQFTQRYAVGTNINALVQSWVEFVPSNPSSYMYLSPERYHFKNGNFRQQRVNTTKCPGYNDYIYGPNKPARYLNSPARNLKENFLSNRVTYLMSEEDKGTDRLDRTCEAMLQGKNRFDRAKNFFYYTKKSLANRGQHRFVSIPRIGHEHFDVYHSQEAAEVIFGLKKRKSPYYHFKRIGSKSDRATSPEELYLLLGGGKNEAIGMGNFLRAARGGDILVISGKDVLNHRYTFDLWNTAEEQGINIDSVETISFLDRKASKSRFIIKKIQQAEAIFFTGGSQAKYINRIKGTPVHRALLDRVRKGIAIAGTSAGLAVMGEYIFSAKKGGLRSRYVLQNPHSDRITIDHDFLEIPLLQNLITDTHFMNRDREGRLLGFMFRTQYAHSLKTLHGVGLDEVSSLQISRDGMVAQGGVYLYRSQRNSPPQRQANPLSFGPLSRLKIPARTLMPHYRDLDYIRGTRIQVQAGQVSYP